MHLRAASCQEETASGLHSPQDKCQETLPVMDAGAWQPLTQGSCSARPLRCLLGAWRAAWNRSGLLAKAVWLPTAISAVASLKMVQRGPWCRQLSL